MAINNADDRTGVLEELKEAISRLEARGTAEAHVAAGMVSIVAASVMARDTAGLQPHVSAYAQRLEAAVGRRIRGRGHV